MQQSNMLVKFIAIFITGMAVIFLIATGVYLLTKSTPDSSTQGDASGTGSSANVSNDGEDIALRDAERTQNVDVIGGAVESYTADYRTGPSLTELTDYLDADLVVVSLPSETSDVYVYQQGIRCDGEEAASRHYSVATKLESGETYCIDG